MPQLQGKYFAQRVPTEERPALVNEYRRTWAQILGAVAIGVGLYLTWRRIEISQRTLETTQDQQVTERFTRAIDQLGATDNEGNNLLEMRLGGIYALERIARESDQDYWPIMEVLTVYVRQHAPSRPEEGQQGEEDAAVEKSEEDSGGSRQESEPTVLTEANLSGADLSKAENLTKTQIEDAISDGSTKLPSHLKEG